MRRGAVFTILQASMFAWILLPGAAARAADELKISLDVLEVLCGNTAKPAEICNSIDVAMRSNMQAAAIETLDEVATSRSSSMILTSTGVNTTTELTVLGGTMKIDLTTSRVSDERIAIDITWTTEFTDGQRVQGSTQVLSSLDNEPTMISGGVTRARTQGQEQLATRMVFLRAQRR